jgi:hypothetical protein
MFPLGFPAIVTAFYLEIRDSFSEMRSSTFTWPISEYKKILAWTIKVISWLEGVIDRLLTNYCIGITRK